VSGPRAQPGDDAGFTMLEMTVSLALVSILTTIFLAGLIQVIRLHREATAIGDGEAQVARAFRRLDNELRYAADMRTQVLPGSQSTDESLVYLSTAGAPRCYALSLVNGSLQHRDWAPGAPLGTPGVLASGVSAVVGERPFTVSVPTPPQADATVTSAPKNASIVVAVAAGGPAYSHRRELRASFLAPNTVQGPHNVSLDDCVP
jgi:prepilin-type N-terminal cleavage/methylation domain-containing protein